MYRICVCTYVCIYIRKAMLRTLSEHWVCRVRGFARAQGGVLRHHFAIFINQIYERGNNNTRKYTLQGREPKQLHGRIRVSEYWSPTATVVRTKAMYTLEGRPSLTSELSILLHY